MRLKRISSSALFIPQSHSNLVVQQSKKERSSVYYTENFLEGSPAPGNNTYNKKKRKRVKYREGFELDLLIKKT